MKSIKCATLLFIIGAANMQAMDNNNNDDQAKSLKDLKKTMKVSLYHAIENDLNAIDEKASDMIVNYLTGMQIKRLSEQEEELYCPTDPNIFVDPASKSLTSFSQKRFYTEQIADHMLLESHTREWVLGVKSVDVKERLLTDTEKDVLMDVRSESKYDPAYVKAIMQEVIKNTQEKGTQNTSHLVEKARLNPEREKDVLRWTIKGMDRWYKHKRKEQAQKYKAYFDLEYKNSNLAEENKQYVVTVKPPQK